MLLRDVHTTLDDVYALYYVVVHCDAKTTMELLELGLADVNHRNQITLPREDHTTLDDAYAFHYAVVHCDATAMRELPELGLPDVICRNQRVIALHVAAMRQKPEIILSLLTKGAQPTDVTSDGRKALQIAKRLTTAISFYKSTKQGKLVPKDWLCVEILEQSERGEPLQWKDLFLLLRQGKNCI
ncbi:hypothetical protein Cgig2_004408 [Carnegiea gigantea]|uniref:NPR1/NIM1-like C-terminal domain-containing protein n=1 Tax=Carnegiea gigantea TaxID=171969 RepID=A0A9Q1Q5W4_9CARY|nr:hypothetical protein Cgig2_004408 [Carnegiea gigantea]